MQDAQLGNVLQGHEVVSGGEKLAGLQVKAAEGETQVQHAITVDVVNSIPIDLNIML